MSVPKNLKKFLDKNHASYQPLTHERVITTSEVAEVHHTPGREVIKSVVIKDNENYYLFILPSSKEVDFSRIRKILNSKSVDLASEEDFKEIFSDCELGAMPPFGELYGLKTYADEMLKEDANVLFNAGTHEDTVKMSFEDFNKCGHPIYANFAA